MSVYRYNAIMDLPEDREDELDAELGRRVRQERAAFAQGQRRDFDSFVAELER